MSTIKVPKFRSCSRLVQWMEKNWTAVSDHLPARLDADRERVFFLSKESPVAVAACAARYATWAGRLSPAIEDLIIPHKDHLVAYIRNLKNVEFDLSLMDGLAGYGRGLYLVARVLGRLPEHLEKTINEPKYAYLYAKDVLQGRLPLEVEAVFFGDSYFAAKYAFDVIRGYSSVRLPEALHAFMIMKSFENPQDKNIHAYIQAAESDPNRSGNSTVKV